MEGSGSRYCGVDVIKFPFGEVTIEVVGQEYRVISDFEIEKLDKHSRSLVEAAIFEVMDSRTNDLTPRVNPIKSRSSGNYFADLLLGSKSSYDYVQNLEELKPVWVQNYGSIRANILFYAEICVAALHRAVNFFRLILSLAGGPPSAQ